MCWNVSLECLQSVLRNAWKLFSHFYNQSKNQAWPARTFLWPWFFFFPSWNSSVLWWNCQEIRIQGKKIKSTLSQRHFTFVKHLPYNVCGGGLVVKSCSTLVTPWTVAHQDPLSVGFPRQDYWSVLPFPSSGDLPYQGMGYCIIGNKKSNHCCKATVVWGYWEFQSLVVTRWFTNIFPVLFILQEA